MVLYIFLLSLIIQLFLLMPCKFYVQGLTYLKHHFILVIIITLVIQVLSQNLQGLEQVANFGHQSLGHLDLLEADFMVEPDFQDYLKQYFILVYSRYLMDFQGLQYSIEYFNLHFKLNFKHQRLTLIKWGNMVQVQDRQLYLYMV